MDVRRGDIFYIMRGDNVGSEQESGRPAVIVSNEKNNAYSETAEIVYLTTQPKKDLPTHVVVDGTGVPSTALCEQVTTVSSERIGDYKGQCTDEEMRAIDKALIISLGITAEKVPPEETFGVHIMDKLNKVESELKVYKELYRELVDRLVAR